MMCFSCAKIIWAEISYGDQSKYIAMQLHNIADVNYSKRYRNLHYVVIQYLSVLDEWAWYIFYCVTECSAICIAIEWFASTEVSLPIKCFGVLHSNGKLFLLCACVCNGIMVVFSENMSKWWGGERIEREGGKMWKRKRMKYERYVQRKVFKFCSTLWIVSVAFVKDLCIEIAGCYKDNLQCI